MAQIQSNFHVTTAYISILLLSYMQAFTVKVNLLRAPQEQWNIISTRGAVTDTALIFTQKLSGISERNKTADIFHDFPRYELKWVSKRKFKM